MNFRKLFPVLFSLSLTCLLAGCGDMTGRGAAPLDRTIDVSQHTEHPRVGYVYCMRGWLGIFSEGMDALANRIDTDVGVSAVSVADEEHYRLQDFLVAQHDKGLLNDGPLVLLGHSYGADDQIRIAKTLQAHNINVDLLILIDPVTPPEVPTNVKRVYCVFYSHPLTDWYPAWRGVPAAVVDATKTELQNLDLRTATVPFDTTNIQHPTIDKVKGVHDLVIAEIEKVCLPRAAWAQSHATPSHTP